MVHNPDTHGFIIHKAEVEDFYSKITTQTYLKQKAKQMRQNHKHEAQFITTEESYFFLLKHISQVLQMKNNSKALSLNLTNRTYSKAFQSLHLTSRTDSKALLLDLISEIGRGVTLLDLTSRTDGRVLSQEGHT